MDRRKAYYKGKYFVQEMAIFCIIVVVIYYNL